MNDRISFANDNLMQFTLREMQRFATSDKFWIIAIVITIALGVSGPFSTLNDLTIAPRFAYWGGICVFTYFGNMLVVVPIIEVMRRNNGPKWLHAFIASLVGTVPVTVVVWGISVFLAGNLGASLSEFASLWTKCAPIAIAITISYSFFTNDQTDNNQTTTPQNNQPIFFSRIPNDLGKIIYALQAQDHYIQVRMAQGQEMLLMRMEDAIRELDGVQGLRVHRSWWVAIEAVQHIEKSKGKITLTLRDGTHVPVSRTHVKAVLNVFPEH